MFEPKLPRRTCRDLFRHRAPADFRVARPGAFRDMSKFRQMDLYFHVDAPPAEVWRAYMRTSPLAIWPGAPCRLQALYLPSKKLAIDADRLEGAWKRFEKGMKVFVDMSALPPLPWPAMMVGLEIVRLDARRRVVEFRYLEGSPSWGAQVMEFTPERGGTRVLHRTWYRSYSAVVEKLYPWYHRLMIHRMHAAFARELAGRSKASSGRTSRSSRRASSG